MSDKKHVQPKPGLLIPMYDGNGNLPADGAVVVMSSYYWGLHAAGDVTVSPPPPAEDAAPAPAPAPTPAPDSDPVLTPAPAGRGKGKT